MEIRCFEDDFQEWDEFVSRFTTSLFCQSIWTEILREGLGAHPLCFAGFLNKKLVSVCSGIVLKAGPFRLFYSSIPYGGILGDVEHRDEFIKLVMDSLKKRGIHRVRIQPDPFLECRITELRQTLAFFPLLDLRTLDRQNPIISFKKKIRRDIRKPTKKGVVVYSAKSYEDVKAFYKLYLMSMKRNLAVAKYPLEYFNAMFRHLRNKNIMTIYLGQLDESFIAGIVTIRSSNIVHYVYGGMDYRYRDTGAIDLLVYSSIKDSMTQGAEWFDFGGTSPEDEALLRYKTKWGSLVRDVYTVDMDIHPIVCGIFDMANKMLSYPQVANLYNKIMRERIKSRYEA